MNTYKLFVPFFKGYGKTYIGGAIIIMVINAIMLWVPTLTGKAIDTLSNGKEGLTFYILAFFVMAIIITILKYFSRHLLLGSIRKLEFFLRQSLFKHALAIPTTYYEKNGPGKVMALMTNDVTSLRVSLGLGVMIFLDAIFFGLFSFLLLAKTISLQIASIILLPMPLIIFTMIYVSRKMRKRQKEAQNTYSDLTEFTQELFNGMPVIRAFNRESISLNRFEEINKVNYKKNINVAFLDSILAPLTFVAPFVCYAIDIYVCGLLILENQITVGDFVAINGYIILVIGPLMGLGSLSSVLQKGLASLDRLGEFLRIEEEPISYDTSILGLETITAKGVSFTYPDTTEPVIKDISFSVRPGQFIGIVGEPGSGKSTLFKLLLRLQNPKPNTLFIGSQDITKIPFPVLRRSIAYVPPVPYILSGSIKDNIAFGEEHENHLDINTACERAALQRDLGERIENDYIDLTENGDNLSGGQRQRVNIARGLYKNADYLLMDDSFSALDSISASTIIKTLRSNKQQTLLFISQRLEALKEADEIWVFKDGRIIEKGNHQNLLEQQGEYYHLYAKQFEKEEAN